MNLGEFKISQRETEIINLIAQEYTTREIANELLLGYETIHTYRKRLFRKFNVKNVAGLIRISFDLGLLKPKYLQTI